jgi:hypothetical protein
MLITYFGSCNFRVFEGQCKFVSRSVVVVVVTHHTSGLAQATECNIMTRVQLRLAALNYIPSRLHVSRTIKMLFLKGAYLFYDL